MSRPLQIVLSFFVWWILVVAPGVLTVAGGFGKVAEDTDLSAWVFGAWIAFYLAQLAWLMVVVTRAVGHTRTGWIFGQPYQAVLPMLCEIGTTPDRGDTFRLRVDPNNPKHFALEPSSRDDG